MVKLNSWRLNIQSPYWTEYDGDALTFVTDNGIKYAVDFDEDANPYFKTYWLNLTNLTDKPSPGDKKIAQTVICIIEEFFARTLTFCSICVARKAASKLSVPVSSCVGSMVRNSRNTMWRVLLKCVEKMDGRNMWLSSCSAATLSLRKFLLSSTRRQPCLTI